MTEILFLFLILFALSPGVLLLVVIYCLLSMKQPKKGAVIMTLVPSCYPFFHCIAGQCRHTCCRGWEIDIDEDTLALYQSLPGTLGDDLRSSIEISENRSASFRLTEDKRCPFLRSDGLCRVILEKGEDVLSDICAMHPRFCHDLPDRTEIGLGLCCEEAARLVLTWADPMTLIPKDPDNRKPSYPVLPRDRLIRSLQDRSILFPDRIARAVRPGCSPIVIPASSVPLARYIAGLETMDSGWTEQLDRLRGTVDRYADGGENWQIALEQLAVALVFRHMPPDIPSRLQHSRRLWIVHIWTLLVDLTLNDAGPSVPSLIETVRRFSSEIEYSDENPELILRFLTESRSR